MDPGEQLLTDAAEEFVESEIVKGRVPSDFDIGDYLDHWLEKYERIHGDIIDEDDFEELCDKLSQRFVDEGDAYERGDLESFLTRVRLKNLVSTQEFWMNENIKSNSGNHRVVYRDTEFPVDENGYYVCNE